jgi:YegS/Rv2252/BmrU family lipid kinase
MNPLPDGGLLHLIVNPVAGGGRAQAALPAIQSAFEARGVPHRVYLTDAPGAAQRIASNLPGFDPVVGVGGDGTLHEIVGALLAGKTRTERPFGVLPFGTGNDFAREIGLQPLELGTVNTIMDGVLGTFDAGVLDDKPFLNGVGSGFDAQVARSVGSAPAYLRGSGRYLWAILVELRQLRVRNAHVRVDGRVVHDGPSLLIAMMNLPCYGGGLRIAPAAHGNDALLEVVIGKRFSRVGALGILPRLAQGSHVGHPQVEFYRGHEIQVEWSQPTDAHADGELMPPTTRFEVRVLPNALRVFVPAKKRL